jgi:hypothetical protein
MSDQDANQRPFNYFIHAIEIDFGVKSFGDASAIIAQTKAMLR